MATPSLDPEEFTSNRERLKHPDDTAVREAFARLPKRGTILVTCQWERRLEIQQLLAEMGAFAIRLRPTAAFEEVRVTASKGKVGACYETGRRASYDGAAMAVMDDDHHLIVDTIRVCEKTGGLYTLPPYHGLLTVTAGEPGLLARLETDPVPFDCNTFEPDAERLAALPFALSAADEPTVPVFYPGPFSLLVLRDGTILRRGRCVWIAAGLVKDLEKYDGLLAVPPACIQEAIKPASYSSAYRGMGAGCLLTREPTTVAELVNTEQAPLARQELAALANVSKNLRQRLLRLIRGDEPYFILTGSDPKEPLGCCPNLQVGEANHLVEIGILSCFREAAAAADSCTTTFYAFTGEIRDRGNRPEFSVNATRRREVVAALTRMR